MLLHGIKASELIRLLKYLMSIHGDCEVSAGGGDYPKGVTGVYYTEKGDPYTHANSFKVY